MSKSHLKRDHDTTLCGISLKFMAPHVVETRFDATCPNCIGAAANQAADHLEATTDRTNTKLPSELAQGSTNPKDDLGTIIDDFVGKINSNPLTNNYIFDEDYVATKELRTRLQEYITLARIEEAKHYCDEGHYHDKKRDIAMLPSERVEELERLQRDSQPSPYTEALKEHLQEHGCGTGDFKSPQYVGGFIHCEVAKELYKKSKDEPDFKPPTGDSQKGKHHE